jgi:uracil-DNA glycosylase
MIKIDYTALLKDWEPILREPVLNTASMRLLIKKLQVEYRTKTIYPVKPDIFRAFKLTSFDDTRVVILGQDPYPNSKASGIAFGNDLVLGHHPSPSLRLIEECIEREFYNGLNLNFDHSLVSWAKQGVLLLNSALTVVKGQPNSHALYWRNFIGGVLKEISESKTGVVFLLLGGPASSFSKYINTDNNYVFKYVHPAYSARRGEDWHCPFFKKINELIEHQNGKEYEIKW